MTPLWHPPPEYPERFTAEEADAGRLFLLDAFRPPIRVELETHLDAAIRVYVKLNGIVETAQIQREKEDKQ